MAATIGIKIANGEFYSIVDENASLKKRLVLTTVHDNQRSVQIDLYRSFTKTMADALYIGSLVVENIRPGLKGEPSIELILESGGDATISAAAKDTDPASRAEEQYLNVSLRSLDEEDRDEDIPDFELETEHAPSGLYGRTEALGGDARRRKRIWPVVIGAFLVLAALGLGLWYFFFRDTFPLDRIISGWGVSGPEADYHPSTLPPSRIEEPPVTPPEPAPPPEPQITPPEAASALPPEPLPEEQPEPLPEEPPVITAPVNPPPPVEVRRTRPVPPVSSYRAPTTIPRGGAPYRIRWGDTLWDIAEAFYRNPWLYPRIARFNNIRDPDFIISGTMIRVPPRN